MSIKNLDSGHRRKKKRIHISGDVISGNWELDDREGLNRGSQKWGTVRKTKLTETRVTASPKY